MNANQTIPSTTPRHPSSGWPTLDPGQKPHDTHAVSAGVEPSDSTDQNHSDIQRVLVGAVIPCDPTSDFTTPNGITSGRTPPNQPQTIPRATPIWLSSNGWLELRIWAEMFHDAQKSRIANVNRAESDGVDPAIYAAHIATLERTEHECRLALRRTFRRVAPPPIVEWQKNATGIGIDLLARLLGHMGHPRWATPHHWEGTGTNRILITDPPFERSVGQLWQFSGHGAPGRKWKGMTADDLAAQGSPTIKMLVHLNAEACMKCMTSPFRLVYEQARLGCIDRLHTAECVRCGPSGKPAQIGTPWRAGHQHAHALRIVGKEILRDLWKVAAS